MLFILIMQALEQKNNKGSVGKGDFKLISHANSNKRSSYYENGCMGKSKSNLYISVEDVKNWEPRETKTGNEISIF